MMDRQELKRQCLLHLDACTSEHPAGHQGTLAARYLLRRPGGDVIELMFEKGAKTPANLWVAHRRAVRLLIEPGLHFQSSPASALYAKKGTNGKPIYGRHSALKPMRELVHADLICFSITAVDELERILGQLDQ